MRVMWLNRKRVWYYAGNISACTPTPGPKPKWGVDMVAVRRALEAGEYFNAMSESGEAPLVHFTEKCEVVPQD